MFTKGGERATAGTYWNVMTGERVDLERESVLPGTGQDRYLRAPSAILLAAGPMLGLIFAMFLPFIGIAMSVSIVMKKLGDGVSRAAAGSMSFGWRPIEAYLAGRKKKKEARGKKPEKKTGA